MASSFYSGRDVPARAPREQQHIARGMSVVWHAVEPAKALDAEMLSAMIECEVIPRLMGAHPRMGEDRIAGEPQVTAQEVATFAPLTLQLEADELLALVDRLLARGISAEALLLDLLAPAARTLGTYWDEDRCDFIDVTMGLWRLQEVVHELSMRLPASSRRPGDARRALFAPVPGDQHSFGPLVIEQVFARAGWDTDRISETTTTILCDRVASEWFDIAGLTGSSECHIGALPSIIVAMRSVSRNPHLRVMVGGPAFLDDPQLVERVGADGTAPDARAALTVAEDLLGAVAHQVGA